MKMFYYKFYLESIQQRKKANKNVDFLFKVKHINQYFNLFESNRVFSFYLIFLNGLFICYFVHCKISMDVVVAINFFLRCNFWLFEGSVLVALFELV